MKQQTIDKIDEVIDRLENGNYTIKIIAETIKEMKIYRKKYVAELEQQRG